MERSLLDQVFVDRFSSKEDCGNSLAWLEADQLIKEGIKSASLFLRGKVGLAASAALFALDEVKSSSKEGVNAKILDCGLGALKGSLLHFSFHGVESFPTIARALREKGINTVVRKGLTADPLLKHFPEKLNLPARAMGMGIATSVIESSCTRNTWLDRDGKFDVLHGSSEIANRSASLPTLLGYAGVFGSGMILSKGINRLGKGMLERNAVAAASTMNASVGLVTGGLGEASRENAAGENLDAGKIAVKSLLNAGISAIAAVPGSVQSERQVIRELTVKRRSDTQVEEVGSGKVNLMACAEEPKAAAASKALVNYFKSNGRETQPCDWEMNANYYRVKGLDTLIVVPQPKGHNAFSGSLEARLNSAAQALSELPNANLIKELQMFDLCLHPKVGDANKAGRVRSFRGSDAGTIRHELGHLQDWAQPGLISKFKLAAEKENAFDEGWNPAEGRAHEHARSNEQENLATLSERLQGKSAGEFLECLQDDKAPLRSIMYGDALKKAAVDNQAIDPAYLRRLDVLEEHARPRQAKLLKETIQNDIVAIKGLWDKILQEPSKESTFAPIAESLIGDTIRDLQLLAHVGSAKDIVAVKDILRQVSGYRELSTEAFKAGVELLADNSFAKAKFVQEVLSGNNSIELTEQHRLIKWLNDAIATKQVPVSMKKTVDNWYVQHHEKLIPMFVLDWLASISKNESVVMYGQIFDSAKERYFRQNPVFQNRQSLIERLEEGFSKSS